MNAERRLLLVTESLGVGGTESHLIRVIPRISASGWEVATFCLSGRGERARELESKGFDVFCTRPTTGEDKSKHRKPVFITRSANSLFWLMRRWHPQIAHFYLPGPYVVGALTAIANGTPVKIMSRRSLSVYQENWPTVTRVERRLHKKMDALVGNSQAVVAQLIGEGAPEDKVRLIYNGIDAAEALLPRSTARQQLGLNENALVGIVVANLIHYKGHQDLIRGLGQVARQLPLNWRVLLAGRDQGLHAMLGGLAETEGIAGNIKFLGQRSDVPRLLAAADFGLLTSHEEGFSNVILECMAAGLPMVVTDVGGNPEAVVNEKNGLVVPPRNPHAIGEAILRLARDADLRKQFGAAGRDRALTEFSLDRCVAAHAELYDELLAKAGQRTAKSVDAPTPPRRVPAHVPARRPLMLAYWGRYGALPQLTLEVAQACKRLGRGSQTTISISTSNELFDKYRTFGEAIFPVHTYASPLAALDMAAVVSLRRSVRKRLVADGARAFVSLMPHIWSPLIAPMLQQAGIRHTVIVHDADPHMGDRTAWVNRWLLREATAADQVVALTNAIANRLIDLDIVSAEKISVLFHPDLTYGQIITDTRGNSEALRVAFFGRLLPYKGMSVFVRAMEILKKANLPIHVGVFGAGEMGREREPLERLNAEIVNSWLDPNRIAGILARQDVVVVSHTKASQSGVIAAAHGAGIPVVATPVGGLPEQIIPNVTGVIARDITAEAVADAVRSLAVDRNFLLRIRRGINSTKEKRSIDRFVCELSEIALKGA